MPAPRHLCWIGLSLLVAMPGGPARAGEGAEVCGDLLQDWRVDTGELRRGVECGTFIGTTDAGTGIFSYGHFVRRAPVELPYEAQVTWRGLGRDGSHPLELGVLGAIVLLTNDACGLFVSNESFAWQELLGYRALQEHTVMVRQDAKQVTLYVDGAKAHAWPFVAPIKRGELAVGLKGVSGYRSRMLFRDVQVRPFTTGEAHRSPVTGTPPPPR